MHALTRLIAFAALLSGTTAWAGDSPTRTTTGPQIQWFGTWEAARAEAARTNRPILLTSAAPACQTVSGIW